MNKLWYGSVRDYQGLLGFIIPDEEKVKVEIKQVDEFIWTEDDAEEYGMEDADFFDGPLKPGDEVYFIFSGQGYIAKIITIEDNINTSKSLLDKLKFKRPKGPKVNWDNYIGHDLIIDLMGKTGKVRLNIILDTVEENKQLLEFYLYRKELLEFYYFEEVKLLFDLGISIKK